PDVGDMAGGSGTAVTEFVLLGFSAALLRPLWRRRALPAHGHGPWPLSCHLPAAALLHADEPASVRRRGGRLLPHGTVSGTIHSCRIFALPFHGANTIQHFLCDTLPVLRLPSASTFWGEVGNLVVTIAFILTPFSLTVASYACILATILGVATSQGRRKIFSTCSSHLFVVVRFFGTGTIAYMRPGASSSQDRDQILALFYTVVTPMFNPFVYTLRNKEVTGAVRRLMRHLWSP
ncbi:hypothetical protein CB1_046670001, partial [Camelus ferus]